MAKQSAYLKNRQALNQSILDVGMDTGFQKCWDLIQLALRDPEFMGKDTFGKKRMKKLYNALVKYERMFGRAWLLEVDSDVLQEKLDVNLKEVWGDEIVVFRDRYPFLKQPGYQKARKGWK